jgi:hypothetical protein
VPTRWWFNRLALLKLNIARMGLISTLLVTLSYLLPLFFVIQLVEKIKCDASSVDYYLRQKG